MPTTRGRTASHARSRTLRRIAAVLTGGVMLLATACAGDASGSVQIETASVTPTPPATAAEWTSTLPREPADSRTTPDHTSGTTAAEETLAQLFLASALRDVAAAERTDVEAHTVPLPNVGDGLWLAVTSGPGVGEVLGERQQVAAIYQQSADGEWTEVLSRRLESTPAETTVELITDAGASNGSAWVAVFGVIPGAGTTFELLRYDGEALTSALWWYSPAGEAARLIDLDDDGRSELVIDASDPGVLCASCGVIDHQEVIYRWENGFIRAVEFAPLERESDAATAVSQGIAQTRAGLWRTAATTFAEARNLAPDDANVAWMGRLAARIAEGRLAHAGSAAQPLLTSVLAGEYDAAFALLSEHAPGEALSASGPLVAGTAAEGSEARLGELLVDHASRAIEYAPDLAPAYAIRALGHLLPDGHATDAAIADLETALALAPGEPWFAAAVEALQAPPPPSVEPSPEAPGDEATAEPSVEPTAEPSGEPTSENGTPDRAEGGEDQASAQ